MDLAIDRACALAGLDRDAVAAARRPPLPFLAELGPAESSESADARCSSPRAPRLAGRPGRAARRVADWAGLAVPHGVLSLPYRITVH